MGALSSDYAQHRPGEGLARGSSSFLSNQLSLPPEESGGRDRDCFLHKRKKNSCLSFSGGGLVGFFCLSGSSGTEVLFSLHTYTHMYSHTYRHTCKHLGSLAALGPPQLEFYFCWSPEIPLFPQQAWPESGVTDPASGSHSPALLSCPGWGSLLRAPL